MPSLIDGSDVGANGCIGFDAAFYINPLVGDTCTSNIGRCGGD